MTERASGKWIKGLSPEMSVKEAALQVLEVRLAGVGEALETTQREPDAVENVHQLRVATRRADAALRIFQLCLSKKAYKRGRGWLRGIRQGAGAARDWDVFLESLPLWYSQQRPLGTLGTLEVLGAPSFDFLKGYALGQRVPAQSALEAVLMLRVPTCAQFTQELLACVRPPRYWSEVQSLQRYVCATLAPLLGELERGVAGDLSNYDHLHQVRISGKRLRYAMEIFTDCLPTEFHTLYPLIEEMQEILGRANDSHVAANRLKQLAEQMRAAEDRQRYVADFEILWGYHEQRLPEQREQFLEWWKTWKAARPWSVLVR